MTMKTIDKLDEILKILSFERVKGIDEENTPSALSMLLKSDISVEMGPEQKSRLITNLTAVLENQSFGQLLRVEMDRADISMHSLAVKTKLPENVIGQLMSDSIFTNNVPILMLKSLIQLLGISFENAEKGIRRTFQQLKGQLNDDLFAGSGGALVAAHRKGNFLSKSSLPGTPQGMGKDLFENKEVLEKYLKRLKELIAE